MFLQLQLLHVFAKISRLFYNKDFWYYFIEHMFYMFYFRGAGTNINLGRSAYMIESKKKQYINLGIDSMSSIIIDDIEHVNLDFDKEKYNNINVTSLDFQQLASIALVFPR